MRAIWHNLPQWTNDGNANPLDVGKAEWRDGLKARLDDMAYKESRGTLNPSLARNKAYEVMAQPTCHELVYVHTCSNRCCINGTGLRWPACV